MNFIILAVVGLIFFIIAFKLTLGSIQRLGLKISEFYPFNVIVKRPNLWSTVFYIVIIVVLTSMVVILSGGNTVFVPRLPA